MDAGFLNFHKEEDFTSDFLDSYGDNSESYDESLSANQYHLSWDSERELNGDIGLIPIPTQMDFLCPLSSSPPLREDFSKIMTEWNQLDDFINPATFDITQYIEQPEEPKPRLGGKKIDMENMRYVIDEENKSDSDDEDINVDVETLSDNTSQPILEAGNLNSLLEQFEASETANLEIHNGQKLGENLFEPELAAQNLLKETKCEPIFNIKTEDDIKLFDPHNDLKLLIPGEDMQLLEAEDDLKLDIKILNSQSDLITPQNDLKFPAHQEDVKCINPQENLKLLSFQNDLKLDLKIYPQNDSPVPDLKLLSPQTNLKCISPIKTPKKPTKITNIVNEKIEKRNMCKLEYSQKPSSVPIKDQSKNKQILESLPQELIERIRQSAKRKPLQIIPPIIPTKKKMTKSPPQPPSKMFQIDHDYCSNTPRKDSGFSSCEEDERSILKTQPTVKNADGKLMVSLLKTNTIKKKLNLEEYKKRLLSRSLNGSERSSPAPMIDEDENLRRLKHQEKLMKMAQEAIEQQNNNLNNPPPPIFKDTTPTPPSNIIMKTLVSVATNTSQIWGQLQDAIQVIDHKIQPNSLISSIVEHLPKINSVISNEVEQAQDKTIVYLDKKVERPKMISVSTQTIFGCINNKMLRSRSRSTDSNSSSSSSYSSYSSRSRTPSPVRRKNNENLNAVEERRVIYIGRIANSTTREDLRRRFSKFGEISNVSVHFRRTADNYGFVTFLNKEDAFEAIEHGNDDPNFPPCDLSFGGRRLFCQTTYADLDNVHDSEVFWSPVTNSMIDVDTPFDALLKETQAKMKKRQL